MKSLTIMFLLSFMLNLANSQTISPALTDEYCPTTEYTFTATIPKTYQSMIGVAGSTVTQLPTSPVGSTFTFKGRFGDANQKQTFRIFYTDNTSFDFEFKKIKSLFYSTSCAQVPNQGAVSVPRCQIVNIPITVPNVQWGTNFESPTLCFGSISGFEYQIPNGWNISGQPSNGSNWISGGNSVIVTSDLSNGVGGAILVRPRNTCASGLQNGQTPGQIPINRPAPTLTVTAIGGGATLICSGGSKTYRINGMPAGATVSWSLAPSSAGTVTSINATDVTVTPSIASGVFDLNATVTHCTFSYTAPLTRITVGTPSYTGTYYATLVGGYNGQTRLYSGNAIVSRYASVYLSTELDYATRAWSYIPGPVGSQPIYWWSGAGALPLQMDFGPNSSGKSARFKLTLTNACGSINETYYFYQTGGPYNFRVSPNPATDVITINVDKDISAKDVTIDADIRQITIVDKMGSQLRTQTFAKGTQQTTINVSMLKPDIYVIRIFDGKQWHDKKFIIQR